MENLLSIKKKSFFPGLTLLLAGFLAGMLIPNFIYRFSWKQQAFSAVYLLETYGKTEAGGIDYLLQILWMRGGIFFLNIAFLIRNALLIQPFPRPLAGRTFRIA